MQFYILQIIREVPPDATLPIVIKFFPKTGAKAYHLFIEADTAETAYALAKKKFPYLSFAIQEKNSYDASIAAVIAKRVLGSPKAQSPRTAHAHS